MSDLAGAQTEGFPPELTDLEAPEVTMFTPSLSGPPVSPHQRVHFYDADEWERFIREWATGLGDSYVQIKRLGGPNDRGVDVAGFKTHQGFEGSWDCFQGKHYAEALRWSDVFPEMLKVFVSTVGGHYDLPDRYSFLAPRGCGSSLNRLLSKPTDLRAKFLDSLTSASDIDDEVRGEVRVLAEATDFEMFKSVELIDALATHRRTPYHAARFGTGVPPRPRHDRPPDELAESEMRYVAQLIEVYSEKEPTETFAADTVSAHSKFGEHFQRQRESFYSAEALRLYARDSVPPGTFEALQADVHSGVVELAEVSHKSGMDRLTSVLTAAGQLDLSAHAVISVSSIADRKGICHQLANVDRLTWVRDES